LPSRAYIGCPRLLGPRQRESWNRIWDRRVADGASRSALVMKVGTDRTACRANFRRQHGRRSTWPTRSVDKLWKTPPRQTTGAVSRHDGAPGRLLTKAARIRDFRSTWDQIARNPLPEPLLIQQQSATAELRELCTSLAIQAGARLAPEIIALAEELRTYIQTGPKVGAAIRPTVRSLRSDELTAENDG